MNWWKVLYSNNVSTTYRNKSVELRQYENMGGVLALPVEAEYEEIDKVGGQSDVREQPCPPNGEYELTKCPPYGPVN